MHGNVLHVDYALYTAVPAAFPCRKRTILETTLDRTTDPAKEYVFFTVRDKPGKETKEDF